MPTKSSAAPATLAWSQGDMEQNSAALANGIAAWVNVGAGTPGTWAAIPLGNSSGQIAASQIASTSLQGTDTKVLTAGTVSGTGSPLCTDANGGATTSGCPSGGGGASTTAPAWLENLGAGADGSYEATAASCTSASPCLVSGEKNYTSFTVDSGAYIYSNMGNAAYGGLVIHSQGACTVYGNIVVNGTKNTWPSTNKGIGGGSSGGSGGGTAAGTAGTASYTTTAASGYPGYALGGSAGAASGGTGGSGSILNTNFQKAVTDAMGGGLDGLGVTGATGPAGGSSGGAGGAGGQGLVMMCASINGTGGTVDASGAAGSAAAANNTGGGGGGGGGVIILSSQAAVSNWPTLNVAAGAGGGCGSYTGCGTGGTGGAGWSAEFAGW